MKIAVRYQSRGGNTKAAAKVIAREAGAVALSIDEPLKEPVDLLFIGGGVYLWDADPELITFIRQLEPSQAGRIADFATSGRMSSTNSRIRKLAAEKGIPVCSKGLSMKLLLQGHSGLKREGGHLTEKQIETLRKFTRETIQEAGS